MKQLTEMDRDFLDKNFGAGTSDRVQAAQRRREPSLPDMAARVKELRAALAELAVNKESATLDLQSVRRVSDVLAMSDKLQLKRDRVEQLIAEVGFETVSAVLSTLSGQQATKSLKNVWGLPVTQVTISDVVQMCQARKVSKDLAAETDPYKRFLGNLVK